MEDDNHDMPQIFSVRRGDKQWLFSRRDFLTTSAIATTSLVVGIHQANGQACRGIVGHQDGVSALTSLAQASLLISGGRDNAIRVWSLIDTGLIYVIENAHEGAITALASSPDEAFFFSAGEDNRLKMWSSADFSPIASIDVPHTITTIAITPDNTLLVTGGLDQSITLWSLPEVTPVKVLTDHTRGIYALALSPDGTQLASGSADKTIKLWSLPDGNLLNTSDIHDHIVSALAFMPDGQTLLSGSYDKTIAIHQLQDATHTLLEGHTQGIASLIVTADGDTFITGDGDGVIHIWSLSTQSLLHIQDAVASRVNTLHMGVDNASFLCGTQDGAIRQWALPEPHFQTCYDPKQMSDSMVMQSVVSEVPTTCNARAHTDDIITATSSSDGTLLASADAGGNVKFWTLPTGGLLPRTATVSPTTTTMALSRIRAILVTGDDSGVITCQFEPESRPALTWQGHEGFVRALCFASDDSFLMSAGQDSLIHQWSMADGTRLKTLQGHSRGVYALALTPDGQYLISGGGDRAIRIWSFADDALVHTLEGHHSVISAFAIAPTQSYIMAGGYDGKITQWALATGDFMADWTEHTDSISVLALSPDATYLASGDANGKIVVWSMADQRPIHTLNHHRTTITHLLFTPDNMLISTGKDKTIQLWSAQIGTYISCLLDLASNPSSTEAIRLTLTTGETIILPYGMPIPTGAVCVCNTVKGTQCSCVGHTSRSNHYWYPN